MTHRYRNKEPSTSELRHDWLTDRWVIIAPQRTQRPDDFTDFLASTDTEKFSRHSREHCPFCFGQESETPPAVAVYPAEHTSADAPAQPWLVRVVPNKFPAVNGVHSLRFPHMLSNENAASIQTPSGLPDSSGLQNSISQPSEEIVEKNLTQGIDLFHARHITGAHEVIIESPLHLCSLTQMDRQTCTLVFRAYRDRLLHWSKCVDIAYSVVFKNVGLDAGASLVHTHSQLIATNVLPTDVKRAVQRMELYQQTEGSCLFCQMVTDELLENVRVVAETSDFVAFCPFASRLPSLVTVVPRKHQSAFEDTSDDCLEQLAWLVHRLLRSIEICYPQAAYNYVLHTAPLGCRQSQAFHWRMEIFPRLTRVAGFEWGSDCFINPLPPELAARRLRDQRIL